jgi:predicted glycosyltransferase
VKSAPHILLISGSIGLGHVTRDLAIAAALRMRRPDLRLLWLAAEPALQVLHESGEELAPESERFVGETDLAETLAGPFSLSLTNPAALLKSPRAIRGVIRTRRNLKRNADLFRRLTQSQRFDLIIADEAYDLMLAMARDPALKPAPLAMIFDFFGLDATSRNPLEWLSVQLTSWWWVRLVRQFPRLFDLTLMIGEEADVADKRFGLFLPNRRELARAVTKFVGYVLPFDPTEYADRTRLRERLGYGPAPLVICSIGGTAIGKPLLELGGRSFPIIKRKIPNLQMLVVCGPRLSGDALSLPREVMRRGYVPRLYEHFAACDLAIVQGGGTTTLELTALRRPFIYFPLEDHFEQRCHVAGRIERHRAGVRLEFSQTTPDRLASLVLANIGTEVDYPPIPTNGAQVGAELLTDLLARNADVSKRRRI